MCTGMLLYSGGWPIQIFFWLEWGCSPSALRAPLYPASSQKVLRSSAKADHSFLFLELTTSSLPDGRFFHCRGFYAGSVGGRGGLHRAPRKRTHKGRHRVSLAAAGGSYAAALRTRVWGMRRRKEKSVAAGAASRGSTSCARSTGSVPPSTVDRLSRELLPQTRQTS